MLFMAPIIKKGGFLEKRSAIATITDLASNKDQNIEQEENEEENLEDFIAENRD